jgi:hypothetical protein
MPTIENYAEHPFHFPKKIESTGKGTLDATTSAFEEGVLFPRAGLPDDSGNPIPSKTKVSKEKLAEMQGHPVAKGWFNRTGLIVAEKETEDSAPEDGVNALGGAAKAKPRQ